MKLTKKFIEILDKSIIKNDEEGSVFYKDISLDKLIQAVKERDQLVLGQDAYWSYHYEHECTYCKPVNKRLDKIKQRMEKSL